MATDALRARRLAEVAELRLAIQWAVLHGHPRDEPERRDPMVNGKLAPPGGFSYLACKSASPWLDDQVATGPVSDTPTATRAS